MSALEEQADGHAIDRLARTELSIDAQSHFIHAHPELGYQEFVSPAPPLADAPSRTRGAS
jgi:hypothetical protein